jgi:twitching motility protein PilT
LRVETSGFSGVPGQEPATTGSVPSDDLSFFVAPPADEPEGETAPYTEPAADVSAPEPAAYESTDWSTQVGQFAAEPYPAEVQDLAGQTLEAAYTAQTYEATAEPVVELPLSLAIAAQEAAEVETEPAPAPERDTSIYESFTGGVAEPEPGVELADSEAAEDAYLRSSTDQSFGGEDVVLVDLLLHMLDQGASDLHLTAGARPAIRVNGELRQLEEHPVLTPPVIQRVMYAAITQGQREKFEENLELDFAYSVPGRARFRVNLYRQRDAIGAAFRIIPFEIKKLEDLGVPKAVANFAMLPRGFVLVTGPTGSGKSTTLASIVDMANRQRHDHIMTVEDPIEFLHRHQSCLVNQREIGEDTKSFQNALKHVLRQDPDIILVGEMRDLETISVALTAAETGHLVFATLHTQDAAQTIDRVIDAFPPHQQQQVRAQLAGAIQGVVCQTLAKTRDGKGRVVACEVMVVTSAIRNLIREGKTHQIYSAMQAGSKFGMQTMDQHLAELVNKGTITYEMGTEKCHHIEDFNRLTGRA